MQRVDPLERWAPCKLQNFNDLSTKLMHRLKQVSDKLVGLLFAGWRFCLARMRDVPMTC